MRIHPMLVCGAAIGALTLFLAGCASSGYKQGEATAAGLRESAGRVESGLAKMDQTVAALNDLVNNPQADLRPQYRKFSSSVDELSALAKHVQESVRSMSAKGKEYFDRWEQEAAAIRNEDIRAQSAARKTEVSAALNNVKRKYAEAEIAFQPLMSNLRDLQRYLGTDLTGAGVSSMRNTAAKATSDAAQVKQAISSLATEFKALGVTMSPAGPAR